MTPSQLPQATIAWLDSRPAYRLIQTVAAVALLLTVWLGVKQYEQGACQARYAEASNVSQRARAEAAEVDREAQDEMFIAIASRPRAAIAAVRQYNASRADADRRREANPIPLPPSTNCG